VLGAPTNQDGTGDIQTGGGGGEKTWWVERYSRQKKKHSSGRKKGTGVKGCWNKETWKPKPGEVMRGGVGRVSFGGSWKVLVGT